MLKKPITKRTSKLEQVAFLDDVKIEGLPDSSTWTKEKKLLEYVKCKKDPVYFLETYGVISHPKKGKIPFKLYPFQRELLWAIRDHKNVVVNKTRQMGISTLTAGFTAWLSIFHKEKATLVLATKAETAKGFLEKVKLIYAHTPRWMKPAPAEWNKMRLTLGNGSFIVVSTSASDAGRSFALSLFVVDECAFIENMEKIYTSVLPTISTGGKAFLLSTPNGPQGFFYDIVMKAKAFQELMKEDPEAAKAKAATNFHLVELHWKLHPERDQAWYDEMCRSLNHDARMIAQELDMDFAASGDKVVHPHVIKWYEDDPRKRKVEIENRAEVLEGMFDVYLPEVFEHYDLGTEENKSLFTAQLMAAAQDGLRLYACPDEFNDGDNRLIGAVDVASGGAADYSAFHFCDTQGSVWVSFKGKINTRVLSVLLYCLGRLYHDVPLAIERNSYGLDVILRLDEELMYPNLLEGLQPNKKGYTTTGASRQLYVSRLIGFLSNPVVEKRPILNDPRFITELLTFVWKGGKPQAENKCNDDLVISYAIFCTALGREGSQDSTLGIYQGVGMQVAPQGVMAPSVLREELKRRIDDRDARMAAEMFITMNTDNPKLAELQDQIKLWNVFGIEHGTDIKK